MSTSRIHPGIHVQISLDLHSPCVIPVHQNYIDHRLAGVIGKVSGQGPDCNGRTWLVEHKYAWYEPFPIDAIGIYHEDELRPIEGELV